jgi:hypothetical protein
MVGRLWKYFIYKLTTQNLDDNLLRKHCKEEAYVVTYFLPHVKKYIKIKITRGDTWRKPRRLPKIGYGGPRWQVKKLKD